MNTKRPALAELIGTIPNRLALAGGWIDQPFVSRLNPRGVGSMVVVGLQPTFRFMDRAGAAGSTRAVAMKLWKGRLPGRSREQLVRELYRAENRSKAQPSGSQDMIGLIYPGINRLDYKNGAVFPSHIESLNRGRNARWLEGVLHVLPVAPRPEGYDPLETQHLDPKWIARLGQSGYDCFEAIAGMKIDALGDSVNRCMACWGKILPNSFCHRTIQIDLAKILRLYQREYAGAMYSGCGGGYLLVISKKPVPGAFGVSIRTES